MSGPASDAGTIRREALVRNPESGSMKRALSERAGGLVCFLLTKTYMDVATLKLSPAHQEASTDGLPVIQTQSRCALSIGDQIIIRILRGRREHYADSLDVPHE